MKKFSFVQLKLLKERPADFKPLSSPQEVVKFLTERMADLDREMMVVLNLDAQNQLNSIYLVGAGTVDKSPCYVREVFKTALLTSASAIITAHNHPSGNSKPSEEDHEFVRQIKKAAHILGIRYQDNIIIGDDNYFSFLEKGLL